MYISTQGPVYKISLATNCYINNIDNINRVFYLYKV